MTIHRCEGKKKDWRLALKFKCSPVLVFISPSFFLEVKKRKAVRGKNKESKKRSTPHCQEKGSLTREERQVSCAA